MMYGPRPDARTPRLLAARILALLILITATGITDGRSLDEIRQLGVIRIGVNPNFPVHSFYGARNALEGFDIDVGSRLAQRLGVAADFVPTETALRVPFLNAGRIDISLGALTRTPQREEVIDFTIPLHTEAMGVLTTSRLHVNTWRELNNPSIRLVNMRGNASIPFIQKELPRAQLLLVDGNADTVRSIAQGRADAMVENVAFFMVFTKAYTEIEWRILRDPIQVAYCGVGVAKGNDSLRFALNNILAELHRSGFVQYEWKKWYSLPMLGTIDVNAEMAAATGAAHP
jgi:polar amino acid transport system substrate-binding protein